ncbi:MAG: hypothetical protein E6K53_08070 [Gammaproteobacteria bacterium]|nr:MAG: hypothetical protein E6K53_08070 [Gammaproteobacteria bacterium]
MPKLLCLVASLASVVGYTPSEPQMVDAISSRLHARIAGTTPNVVLESACSNAHLSSAIDWPNFQARYPQGIFVICDWQIKKNSASTKVLHFLFNAGWSKVLLSSEISAGFSAMANRSWQIVEWQEKPFDYTPPLR